MVLSKVLCSLVLVCGIVLCTVETNALAQKPDTKVTLGIKPDYWYTTQGTGVKVSGVLDGQTAQKAGLKAGDIIKSLDGKTIKDIFAYKDALSKYGPGDSVIIAVLRGQQNMVFRTKF